MDGYNGYNREPPLARSPTERTNWAGRDDGFRNGVKNERDDGFRGVKIERDRESFYRGRSPVGGDRQRRNTRDRSRSPVERYETGGRTRDRDDYRSSRDREDRRRIASPAPANIDRYVPGQDSSAPPPVTSNPLADPVILPFQVGFSYYGEWWRTNEKIKEEKERARSGKRGEIFRPREEDRDTEKARIQVAYDAYKEELQARMARTFVQEHKGEQWFMERYVPEMRDALRLQVNEFRRGNYSQWEQDLESGTFDEYSLEGIPKSESNGTGGIIEKEEGETTAANEVLGVGDLVPSRGGDIRDENAFQPTLLIKTIAPHVSRTNLESFCKEHLGEDEGGFKWLSLSDPNPSKRYHRIGWVMLHPAPDSAAILDRPEIKDDEADDTFAEPAAPLTTAQKALEAINGKTVKDEVRGDFTCHVGVHVPPNLPRKKALWDLFSAPERIEKDLDLATRLVNKFEEDFGSDFNAVLKIEEKVDELKNQGRLQPPVTAPTAKKAKKSKNALGLDEAMDEGEDFEEMEEGEEEEEGAFDFDEIDDEELLVKKKQLDLMVEYLRRVFNFCFFCVFESDSIHELTRKCPGGHLRRPRNTLTTSAKVAARASASGDVFPGKKPIKDEMELDPSSPEGERKFSRNNISKAEQQLQRAFNWVRTFEEKILQILDPDNVDVRKLGGKPTDDSLKDELIKFVKQEDDHKYRCRVPDCTKLFKEEHFWKKHVEKRHPEWLESMKTDFNLVNTYVLDPAHIAPSRSDANSNGHFPPAIGHMPAGTPRGFNLQNFGLNGLHPIQGFPPPTGFPPFLAGHAVQSPMGWNGGPDNRGPGPIRRGGRFQTNNRTGPYDRRTNQNRWDPNAGRLSPPGSGGPRRGGAAASGGSRWGDGVAPGGTTVGPREATAGRSIKSYEDLDAVAGSGSGELNY
ncbi:putative Zinc finger protein [Sclerotinia borealis F-4128]|uniref:Putative Zinc finger protein n=1 Tax=Sclerotinia borealis (strain F-4128) TaxID=1432307 RepID=W9CKI5_SCLBF|nr:putative Zinc finger protein [Sclerotinia borealis F-4128]